MLPAQTNAQKCGQKIEVQNVYWIASQVGLRLAAVIAGTVVLVVVLCLEDGDEGGGGEEGEPPKVEEPGEGHEVVALEAQVEDVPLQESFITL